MTITTSRSATLQPMPSERSPDGIQLAGDHARDDIQPSVVPGSTSRPANFQSLPTGATPDGIQLAGDQFLIDAQRSCVPGIDSVPDSGASLRAIPNVASLLDPALALAADVVDDLEKVRIANENRLRQLTRAVADSDGTVRGFGLTGADPAVRRLASIVEALAKVEHEAVLNLQRAMRAHPLGGWVKAQKGIGEKQGARLLAAIGDPYWNALHGRPRTVSELWAYCGYHTADGMSVRRQRGQKANWSATAKMRAHLVAESCMKNRESPYRAVYDVRRAVTADRFHAAPCVRCGPSGKPAEAMTPWSDGHKHADALRVVSKAILRDLWRAAREIHDALG